MAVLAVVSLLPSGTGALHGWDESLSPSMQNLLHLPAYAVLTCVVLAVLGKSAGSGGAVIAATAVACLAYGALLECLQAAGIPGRTGSVSDVLWNAAGVVTGTGVWILCRPKMLSRRRLRAELPSTARAASEP